MMALAIIEAVALGLKVAQTVAERNPGLYEALVGGHADDIPWDNFLLPALPDENIRERPSAGDPLATLDALMIMARTIYGEARNEPWVGMVAVGYVITNRVKKGGWWGSDIISVCQAPYQFSCWNKSDPNRPRLLKTHPAKDVAFRQCIAAAASVMSELEPTPVGHSTHYHTSAILPAWAKGHTPKITIGAHVFYEGIA